MSVVDHRASFAARGGHTTAHPPSARFARPSLASSLREINNGGGGAFHSHSMANLTGDDDRKVAHRTKRHGLSTDAARGLSQSMRELGGLNRSAQFAELLGEGAQNDAKEALQAEGIGDAIKSAEMSGRSISAGEGAWLVKECDGRRKGSRGLVSALNQSLRLDKKDSERFVPDLEEEDAIVAAASVKPIAKSEAAKSVHFSTVDVRHHPVVLGNNPFVTSGPPLELAWDCDPSATDVAVSIDAYEEERETRRRSEWDLALSGGERESRLLEGGCTREEIAAAVRDVVKVKGQRANTVMNISMAGVEEFVEDVARNGTWAVGLRRSSLWLYNDWKNGSSKKRYKSYLAPKRGFPLESPTSGGQKRKSRFRHMKKSVKRSMSELLVPEPYPRKT